MCIRDRVHSDGAGTKSSLAYIYWKETGDDSVWKGIAQDSIVMNVDDVACVGAIDNMVLSSTIGRNKNKIPGDVIKSIIAGTDEVLSEYRNNGINIYSGGGETADVGDLVRTIIVDSSITARVKKDQIINNENIQNGDVIVGLSSFGKSKFENKYNSGIGSNGLTSARHDVFDNFLATKYPESFDPEVPKDLVYSGTKKILDKIDDSELNIGSLVLSPTRTYTPLLKIIFEKVGTKNGQKVDIALDPLEGTNFVAKNLPNAFSIIAVAEKDNLFSAPDTYMQKNAVGSNLPKNIVDLKMLPKFYGSVIPSSIKKNCPGFFESISKLV